MDDTTTAVAIFGGALSLAKPVVESGCRMLEVALNEPLKIIGAMLSDQVYYLQWSNRIRIAHRAKMMLDKEGIAIRALPPGFLLPIVEASGNIAEPELQELWAKLLASGTKDPKFQLPAYSHILRQISRDEALILYSIREMRNGSKYAGHVCIAPGIKQINSFPLDRLTFPDSLQLYCQHLKLLGVIDIQAEDFIHPSQFGESFLAACVPTELPGIPAWKPSA